MRLLLDTSVLIQGWEFFAEDADELAISSLSVAELSFGLAKPNLSPESRAARASRLALIRRQFDEGLPFDDAAADSYGIVTSLIMQKGRQVRGRVLDLMIAATAHSVHATLLTLNPKDFEGIESILEVRSPKACN
jgi:predicted nucleic acid-binding protein